MLLRSHHGPVCPIRRIYILLGVFFSVVILSASEESDEYGCKYKTIYCPFHKRSCNLDCSMAGTVVQRKFTVDDLDAVKAVVGYKQESVYVGEVHHRGKLSGSRA